MESLITKIKQKVYRKYLNSLDNFDEQCPASSKLLKIINDASFKYHREFREFYVVLNAKDSGKVMDEFKKNRKEQEDKIKSLNFLERLFFEYTPRYSPRPVWFGSTEVIYNTYDIHGSSKIVVLGSSYIVKKEKNADNISRITMLLGDKRSKDKSYKIKL